MRYHVWSGKARRDWGTLYCPHCKRPIRNSEKFYITATNPLAIEHMVCSLEAAERREQPPLPGTTR